MLSHPEEEKALEAAVQGRRMTSAQLTVVKPKSSLLQRVSNTWKYRDLLFGLIGKEISVKYKNSVLGMVWSMLNPAMYILIYFLVFQKVMKNGIPNFAIFLPTGLLVWNLFQNSISSATGTIVDNSGLVKKVSFPREILALASVGAAFVFFLFQAIVLVLFMAIFRALPAFGYLWLVPVAMVVLLIVTAALAVFLSAVNVYLRDTKHLVEVGLVAWFWATPVVYPFMLLAGPLAKLGLSWAYLLNPITLPVITFQRALYAKVSPISTNLPHPVLHILPSSGPMWYLYHLAITGGVAILLFLGALYVFGRLEGNFVEEL
ncbi:MAG: ABC transporter permease [Acidimicrobiaceae bacterium]|nr:ABC transporter permease [Acidimicrobiaceae bacterium]